MFKYSIYILFVLSIPQYTLAQDQTDLKVEIVGELVDTLRAINPKTKKEEIKLVKSTLYKKVDQMPIFFGCESDKNPTECSKKKMIDFLFVNMKYPKPAKKQSIQGVIYAKYVVMPDGVVAHAKIDRGLGGGCDEEVLRFIQLLPTYTPGKLDGKAVPVQLTLPVKFKLMK